MILILLSRYYKPISYMTPHPQQYVHRTNDAKHVRFPFMFRRIYAKVFHSRCLAKLALNDKYKIHTEVTDWQAFLYDPSNGDPDAVRW